MAIVKLTNEELRMKMQGLDNVATVERAVILSEGTSVPIEADIVIHVGVDMIPTITYTKETYVYPQ